MKARFLLFFIFLAGVFPVLAQEQSVRNDYKVEYFVTQEQGELKTKVVFSVSLTNLTSTVYVDKIALSFPESFSISNIQAADNKGAVLPVLSEEGGKTVMSLAFNNPDIGRNVTNSFRVEFFQENVLAEFGNIWEAMIPTIKNVNSYTIRIHLPPEHKKLSIAKPKPSTLDGNTITWNNPKSEIIYAVFGDTQYYNMDLVYHLENTKIIPVYQEVAFPPDTQHQTIYLGAVTPEPDKVFVDEDGNYMAQYTLKPKEKLDIRLQATAKLQVQPRDEVVEYERGVLDMQKEYLLNTPFYWKIPSEKKTPTFENPQQVYEYVVDTLDYHYAKLESPAERTGVSGALANPAHSVCTEFTDTFIAFARSGGVYAREVQGYGFSHDEYLRPLSKISDVLHAWPEFYDSTMDLWRPVDPTWENTSGIDYFSSFDLNHIAFVIHGKDPEYPYPAGSYKLGDTKDLTITPTTRVPEKQENLKIHTDSLPPRISDSSQGTLEYEIENTGNVYLWNIPVEVTAKYLQLPKETYVLKRLAPYEKKVLQIPYSAAKHHTKLDETIIINILDTFSYTHPVAIVPRYFVLAFNIAVGILAFGAFFFLIKTIKHIFS